MFCDNDFVFCKPNASCHNNGVGRFLFYNERDSNEKLYIHLRKKKGLSFYCIYRQKSEYGKYQISFFKVELQTESSSSNVPNKIISFVKEFRQDFSIEPEGWKEQMASVVYNEEIEFLNSIDSIVEKMSCDFCK